MPGSSFSGTLHSYQTHAFMRVACYWNVLLQYRPYQSMWCNLHKDLRHAYSGFSALPTATLGLTI